MRNEIKLKFEEPEYTVNSDKGTVECFLKYEILYPETYKDILAFHGKVYSYTKAVAKVGSDEIFNEHIGKKVSLAKAEKKAYARTAKRLNKRLNKLAAGAIRIANNFIYKADRVITHNNEYLKQF